MSEPTYVIEGRVVTMPVMVRDACSASATYLVPAGAAQKLVPQDLVVAEVAPRRTLFSVAAIRYRDNDLGDYNEVSLAFFVRLRAEASRHGRLANAAAFFRNGLATYIHRLPVNQTFTCSAGRGIWGFPKTVERIDFDTSDSRAHCHLASEGRDVLRFAMARGGRMRIAESEMTTYSRIAGAMHATRFVSGAEGVGIHIGGAELDLGTHPIADELRSLGLPKRALLSVWMEHMRGRFDAPRPVDCTS